MDEDDAALVCSAAKAGEFVLAEQAGEVGQLTGKLLPEKSPPAITNVSSRRRSSTSRSMSASSNIWRMWFRRRTASSPCFSLNACSASPG